MRKLRGAKEILRYLHGKGVSMGRDTLWRLTRERGKKKFPIERVMRNFRMLLRADVDAVDQWIASNSERVRPQTSSTLSGSGPELPASRQ